MPRNPQSLRQLDPAWEIMNRVAEPYIKVTELVNGFGPARVLHVAVELDLFSKLANEGKSAAQLSVLVDAEPRALELLLNALTGLGLLRKEAERFYDTPISHTYLSRTGPKYLGSLILHLARRWSDWGELEKAVRTGRSVRSMDQVRDDPMELEYLIRGMHELALARGDARYLSRAIPLGRCRRLLDVGGGPGTYAAMFCHENPGLQAVVLDLPATLKITRRILREFDRTGRVSTMAGDYRSDKIKGAPYDVVLISNILHAEDEDTNRALLSRVRDALTPGGILIIKDHILGEDHTTPPQGALFGLQMMLLSNGRTYSFVEISSWLEAAGFDGMVEVPMETPMNVSLVFAMRPGKRPLAMLPKPAARVAAVEVELPDAAAEVKEGSGNGRPEPRLAAPPLRAARKPAARPPSRVSARARPGKATAKKSAPKQTKRSTAKPSTAKTRR